MESIQKILL